MTFFVDPTPDGTPSALDRYPTPDTPPAPIPPQPFLQPPALDRVTGTAAAEITWVDGARTKSTTSLRHGDASAILRGYPIRRIQSRRAARSITGRWWTSRLNASSDDTDERRSLIGFESRVEARFLLACEFDPNIVAVAAQPFRISAPGRPADRHVPDYIVQRRDGTVFTCDVRPEALFNDAAREVATDTRALVSAAGWAHLVFHDLDPVVHRNLDWLARMRTGGAVPALVDAARRAMTSDTYGTLELKLLRSGVPQPFIRPAIDSLIWGHEFSVDLARRLDIDTILHRTPEIAALLDRAPASTAAR